MPTKSSVHFFVKLLLPKWGLQGNNACHYYAIFLACCKIFRGKGKGSLFLPDFIDCLVWANNQRIPRDRRGGQNISTQMIIG